MRERLWKPVITFRIDSDREPGCCGCGFTLASQRNSSSPPLEPFHSPTGWLLGGTAGGGGAEGCAAAGGFSVSHAYPQLTRPQTPSTSVLMGTPRPPAPSTSPPGATQAKRTSPLPTLSGAARAHSAHAASPTHSAPSHAQNHGPPDRKQPSLPPQGHQGSREGPMGPPPSLQVAGERSEPPPLGGGEDSTCSGAHRDLPLARLTRAQGPWRLLTVECGVSVGEGRRLWSGLTRLSVH